MPYQYRIRPLVSQDGTFTTVREIMTEGQEAASHMSCIGATKASMRANLAQLKAMGVKRIVALRGDLPSGYGAGGVVRQQFGDAEIEEFGDAGRGDQNVGGLQVAVDNPCRMGRLHGPRQRLDEPRRRGRLPGRAV